MDQHWTDEVDGESDVFFATLSEREIRRRQDLCRQQKRMAHEAGNGRALVDLQRMEDALIRSLCVRMAS